MGMSADYSKVVVTDIKIPFGSMVVLMVKWAVATIPAFIILALIGTFIFNVFGILFRHIQFGWM
jgi:hypothetical protein